MLSGKPQGVKSLTHPWESRRRRLPSLPPNKGNWYPWGAMSSGINQDVEILGKVFHLQTQVSGGPQSSGGDLSIRTEVFIGGKLVATRDGQEPLPSGLAETEIRQRLKEHHQRILQTITERAHRYRKVKQEAPPKKTTVEAADDLEAMTGPVPVRPKDNVDIALRVRRILERFRSRLGVEIGSLENDPEKRLRRAARGFAWVLQSPDFEEIRIDEQVRFNLLKDQIDDWLEGTKDPAQAQRIWAEAENFNEYLAGINNRAELAAFDRDLLRWTLRKVEANGVSNRLLRHLEMIRGRDVALDRLLSSEQSVGLEVWLAHLRRILEDLESPDD